MVVCDHQESCIPAVNGLNADVMNRSCWTGNDCSCLVGCRVFMLFRRAGTFCQQKNYQQKNSTFCGASKVSLRKVIFDHSYVDVVMGSASTMRTVFLSRESSFACLLGVVETSVYNVGRFFCLSRTESRCQQCVSPVETSVLQLHEFRISEDTSHVLVLVLGDIGRSPRMQMRTQTIQPNPS